MDIDDSVALVTGANRGLGAAVAQALLAAGARKVYAGVRDPAKITDPALTPVHLDVTDPELVQRAAAELGDVSIVVNNAGIGPAGPVLSTPLDYAWAEMEVNYFGALRIARAFAPTLAANGGGALVSVLSALALVTPPWHGTYSASKAAALAATNSLRVELRDQGTDVLAVYMGYVDTDMFRALDVPKLDAEDVATRLVGAIAEGVEEVFVDEASQQMKAALPDDLGLFYPAIHEQYAAMVAAPSSERE